ncbi:uncharacterized protein LOC118647639 isoform X2 [Monomorium pharaonis]|uniref:uncharacterized protein LOC118647639 isoform X2 n=1 Tax=Monomorium pharaonis TaxID=307658 RepID=UPI0017464B72|nr:uncharacterized protein LOC118647639 isoform X2 [Monomorium pharaonis]
MCAFLLYTAIITRIKVRTFFFILQIIFFYNVTFSFFKFAVVEFDDSCDESQTLIEVIPFKWLFDNNTKCNYPPKKDQLKTTRLVMSKMDPGKDWNTYHLRFHHYYSTYNIVVKTAKNVLEGNVARTEVGTDYDQPRKRKKNKKYIESSDEDEDNPSSNIFCSASNKVPAPNPLLPNKIKTLFKNKSIKTSMICQKDTSVGKLFSRKESRVTSLSPSKLTYKTTLDENPMKHHSMLEETVQQRDLVPEDCNTKLSENFGTANPLQ